MNLSLLNVIGIFFLIWMIYFALGAFANMTESKLLLNIFKYFKYILIVILVVLIAFYFFNNEISNIL